MAYKIVRTYKNGVTPRRTIKSGLTLAEVQQHCRDAETSSRTATSARAKRITAAYGEWFDGYEECKK